MSTPKVKLPNNETEFNSLLRGMLKGVGFQCRHVRETDEPGFPDLLIWRSRRIICLLELKYNTEELDISQKSFHRNHPEARVATYWPEKKIVTIKRYGITPAYQFHIEQRSPLNRDYWETILMDKL